MMIRAEFYDLHTGTLVGVYEFNYDDPKLRRVFAQLAKDALRAYQTVITKRIG